MQCEVKEILSQKVTPLTITLKLETKAEMYLMLALLNASNKDSNVYASKQAAALVKSETIPDNIFAVGVDSVYEITPTGHSIDSMKFINDIRADIYFKIHDHLKGKK